MRIEIASPCAASWASMRGDARVRTCGDCRLRVYNVSDMTEPEARQLLREKEGRVCVRLYQRRDGTVLTRDCPEGRARRFARRSLAVLATLMAAVLGSVAVLKIGRENVRAERAVRWVKERFEPERAQGALITMGKPCLPPGSGTEDP